MTDLICTVCNLAAAPTDTLTVAGKVVCGDCLYEAKLPREGQIIGVIQLDGSTIATADGVQTSVLPGGELG